LLVYGIQSSKIRRMLVFCLIAYNVVFLEMNNLNWIKASTITQLIVQKIRNAKDSGTVYFVNIPNEIVGAYVFRQGFSDASRLYHKESNRCVDLNYTQRSDPELIFYPYSVLSENGALFIPKEILLKKNKLGNWEIYKKHVFRSAFKPGDKIFFWNYNRLDSIQNYSVPNAD
jgi:protein O-mannosyl-transferase